MPCLLALVEEREVLVTVLGTLNTNAVKKEGQKKKTTNKLKTEFLLIDFSAQNNAGT